VTAGLAAAALLLAFLFHLGVAAVALAILATVPALYLAWKALPAGPLRPLASTTRRALLSSWGRYAGPGPRTRPRHCWRDRAAHASLQGPGSAAALLEEPLAAGADNAAQALLARDRAAHASLDNPVGVDLMLIGLRMAGAEDAVRVLANRAANAGMFYARLRTYPDEAASYRYGREPDGTPAQPWRWQETGGDP